MDIDRALARALDADDPGPAFAGKVIAALNPEAAGPVPIAVRRSRRRTILWRAALPMAATIALVTAGARFEASRAERAARLEREQARAAHAQLVQALRLTGEKLSLVHRAIDRARAGEPRQE
jgi:hypothetical protein